jgi:radical SAM superfamily enzyme YgiQ (UPF0313 family)
MKILLIHPRSLRSFSIGDNFFVGEPLALEYLAAGLSEYHDIKLVDTRFEDNLEEIVENFSPDIVGLTAYTFQVNAVKKISQQIKKMNPHTLIVVGGHHATVAPHDFYEPSIDIVVKGEGVLTFNEIVKRIEKRQSLSDLQGISLKIDGHFKENESKFISDLDILPIPRRELAFEVPSQGKFQEFALLVTSKGCPHRCNFCCCWKTTGGKYLTRDLQAVIEEMKIIKQSVIHFADDESFIDPKRMMQFAGLIEKAGIQKDYISYARADTIVAHPDLFRKWKDIGLSIVAIGIESHKNEYLNKYNKKSSVALNNEAIGFLKDIGVSVLGSLMIRPDFDEKDFDELADYVISLQVDMPIFNVLTPLPGSQLYEEQRSKMISHNYDLFDFLHTVLPTKLSLRRFYGELYHLYVKVGKSYMKKVDEAGTGAEIKSFFLSKENTSLSMESLRSLKNAYLDYQ